MLVRTMKSILRSVLHPLLKNRIYTIRHGLAKGLKRKGGLGFVPQFKALTLEEEFLLGLDLKGQTVYDVGGCVGAHTLFFCRVVGVSGNVITFEPNPKNYDKITENIKLNKFDNVQVLQIGLGKEKEQATLAFHPSEMGRGSIQQHVAAQVLEKKGAKTIQVEVDSLDNQIAANDLPRPDFIKIDVEGLELDVLLGMKETIEICKPRLFVEIHNVDAQQNQKIVDLLIASGYAIRHIEARKVISSSNAQIARGHLYCD